MTAELTALLGIAASIAFLHTLLGPDHILPFVALSRERGWTTAKTASITAACGVGHAAGSIILGLIGVAAGSALADLAVIETVRGGLAAWILIAFGLLYMAWGIRQTHRKSRHSHWHAHADGIAHSHDHSHHKGHLHVHAATENQQGGLSSYAPWTLFIIFLLGPCEPLIPLMMAPASSGDWTGVLLVTGVFTLVTVATMTTVVVLLNLGIKGLPSATSGVLERHRQTLTGGTLALGGLLVVGFGL